MTMHRLTAEDKKAGDKQVVYNLRFKFPNELEPYSDDDVIAAFDNYSLSEDFGDPSERQFLAWLPIK